MLLLPLVAVLTAPTARGIHVSAKHSLTASQPDAPDDVPRPARGVDEAAIATDLIHVLRSWVTGLQLPSDKDD